MKGRQHVRCTCGRSALEEPNNWHRGLLRACRQRARNSRAAAKQDDEIAPSYT
jgi:hypothetical protein